MKTMSKAKSSVSPRTRKIAEKKLHSEDQLFRALAEQSSDIILLVNSQGVVIYENNAVERILGFKARDRIGNRAFDNIHPDESRSLTETFHKLITDEKASTQEDEALIRDIHGNWHIFEVVASNLTQNNVVEAVVINLRDVTERRRAEEDLRRSEEKYRSILENISEGYYESNLHGDIVFANDSGCAMLGYDREAFCRISYRQFSTPETKKRFRDTYSEVFKSGVNSKMDDYEVIRRDGSIRIHQMSVGLIRNAAGDAIGFRAVARDVTEKKQAEESLRRSEEKYRLLADHMKDQVWLMDLDLNLIYISPSVEKLLGYAFDELRERPLDKLLAGTSYQKAMEFFSVEMPGALASPLDYVLNRTLELEFRCKDGRNLWTENTFSFIRNEYGRPVSLLIEGRDMTERKRVQEALRLSEERYRNILDHMEEAYYEVDLKGNLTFFNPAVVKNLGYTDNMVMGMNFRQFVDEENAGRVFDAFHRVFLTGETIKGVDWELIGKESGRIPVASSISLRCDARGKPVGFRGVIRDITDRKRADEALRESEARHREQEERYRNILDNMEEAYYEVDLKGNMTFFSTAAVKNLGYTGNVLMGMNFRQYVDKENEKKVFDAFHKVFMTGETIKGVDWEATSREKGKIPVESSISLVRNAQGEPVGFRGIIRDITERKKVEEALRESEIKFRNLTENAQDAIIAIDMRGMITYANPAAKVVAGNMDVIDIPLKDFLPFDIVEPFLDMLKSRRRGFSSSRSYESKIIRPQDERPIYFDVKASMLMTQGKPSGVLFIARDATRRKEAEEKIRLMAILDTLTGLYNRGGFITLAEQQMKTAARDRKKLLLFFIDLDGLKFINDTWGHEEGDRALRKTSAVLKATFRSSDIICRLGGDEFAALVFDSPELPEVILTRLQGRIDAENASSNLPYQISMSTGVSSYDPSSPCSIHELMSQADHLMYIQKKERKLAR